MPPLSANILDSLYNATMLLSVGLTTILAPIFAIATTFLGRSLQQEKEMQEQEEQEARDRSDATKERLIDTLANEGSESVIESLQKQLREAEKSEEVRRRRTRRRQILQGPHLLGVKESVIFPGFLFVLAAAIAALGRSLMGYDFELSGIVYLTHGSYYGILD